jgi:DDE superfamily endonuclease
MEEVLERSHLPSNPHLPLGCMDEQPVQRIAETRPPLPAAPGKPAKVDYEYERHGTANICMCTEPLTGTRHVHVTEHRTAVDWAHELRDLLDMRYPEAARIRLGCDNLNTHGIGSLYAAYPPDQARALAQRLEIHSTPKHGRWLNRAEIERSALTGQCRDRRMPDIET